MNNDIYKQVLGTLLRHFFGFLAGFLAPYGVSEAMQGQLIEATIFLTISAVFSVGTVYWSYLQKKFQIYLKFEARESPTDMPMGVIEQQVVNDPAKTGTTF